MPKDRARDIAYRWSCGSHICIGLRGARLVEHACYHTFTRVPAMLMGVHESDWGGGLTVNTSCAVCLDTGKVDLMDLSEEFRCALADDPKFQAQRIVIDGRSIPLQQPRSRWPLVTDLAALRLLALKVVTDSEKATALGFESVEAMREHGAWLGRYGTPEYKAWAASIAGQTENGAACAPDKSRKCTLHFGTLYPYA